MPIVEVPVEGRAGPYGFTPVRAPGSVRRTSHVDVDRQGTVWDAPTAVTGTARDLITRSDGSSAVRAEVRLWIRAEGPGGPVTQIRSEPSEPGLDALVGTPVMVGFRRALAAALPEHVRTGSTLYRLLDDVPLAFLVSGHAMMLGEPEPGGGADADLESVPEPAPRRDPSSVTIGPAPRRGPMVDVCAGWQADGMLGHLMQTSGTIPHSLGPLAPPLGDVEDPLGWHDRPPVPFRVTRRTRRIDVTPARGERFAIDAHFRDSYGHVDGSERSLHEYTIAAEVDLDGGTIRSASAIPRALPWPECPQAVASAERLAGLRLRDLSDQVRREFTGITTCTHLNDMMRSLADAAALIEMASGPESTSAAPEDKRP